MRKSIVACFFLVVSAQAADPVVEEWRLLRPHLQERGIVLVGEVTTREQVAEEMARVRRELQMRRGAAPQSRMSRIGGGGGPQGKKKPANRVELRSKIKP